MAIRLHPLLVLVFLVSAAAPAWSQVRYPLIGTLGGSDIVYHQLEEDIAQYYLATHNGQEPPRLVIYAYRTKERENLFEVAASANLPYDTIATLNGLSSATSLSAGTLLLLANMPGVFVPEEPKSDLEYLMASWREKSAGPRMSVTVMRSGRRELYAFYPGAHFHAVERAYFLGILFRFPLPKGVLSSPFGLRTDPFSHVESFHPGIDIAAPSGTEVFAAREGVVEEIATDRELGTFVLVRHQAGYETLYAHLSAVGVQLNQRVSSGMIVGEVGSTGMSTGPHLHFEILRNGHPEDPLPLLPKGGG